MNPAVAFLRNRTVVRSARAYTRWVGKAIGWWTVAYLLFWLIVFVIAAVEAAGPRSAQTLPASIAAFAAGAVGFWLAAALARGRVPPVHLDRRDLYRLALAPAEPRDTLRYRLNLARVIGAVVAALVGAIWSLFAHSFLGIATPWAAPTAALLAVFRLDLRWLRYASRTRGSATRFGRWGVALGLAASSLALVPAALALLGDEPAVAYYSLVAALVGGSPLVVVLPLVMVVITNLLVGRSLASDWPPRFAAQSFVLSQLQGMRTLQVISAVAGVDLGSRTASVERERLLAALHDRPGSVRPARSVRRPGPAAGPWTALAWRGVSSLFRRPLHKWLWSAVLAFGAVLTALLAAPAVAGAAGAAASGSASVGGLLGGAVSVLIAGFVIARATASLLGPPLPTSLLPVSASERSWGRVAAPLAAFALIAPLALVVVAALPGAIGAGLDLATGVGSVALLLTVALVLERYSSWSGAAAGRWEPQAVAAIAVALPALLLHALGYPGWTMPVQWVLLMLVSLIDV